LFGPRRQVNAGAGRPPGLATLINLAAYQGTEGWPSGESGYRAIRLRQVRRPGLNERRLSPGAPKGRSAQAAGRDLRRTGATPLHTGGTPPTVVQELLGHSTMTTITLGSHAHTTTLHQQEATYFDRLLSGAQRS